jgi:hypothetical protein
VVWLAESGGVMDDPGSGGSDSGGAKPPIALALPSSPSPFRMEGPSNQAATDTTANAATAIPSLATARMVSLEMVLMGGFGVGEAVEARRVHLSASIVEHHTRGTETAALKVTGRDPVRKPTSLIAPPRRHRVLHLPVSK